MSVVVEVPDQNMSKLAKRLIGRRSGVSVAVAGEAASSRVSRQAGSEPPRKILVRSNGTTAPTDVLDLLHNGIWAVLPAEEDTVSELLRSYVDQVRVGLSPLLSEVAGDRDEFSAFLEGLKVWRSGRRVRTRSGADNPLSERETQILQRIARGVTSREIADEMGFQLQTVKNKVTTILTKTHARSRTHAVSIALRSGWISGG